MIRGYKQRNDVTLGKYS